MYDVTEIKMRKGLDNVYLLCQSMIVVFGSSLNLRCTVDSDLDLAIKLKDDNVSNEIKTEISEKIQSAYDWNADILWRDRLNESDRILHEIRKGVILH